MPFSRSFSLWHSRTVPRCNTLQQSALQHGATHRNTLQHIATHVFVSHLLPLSSSPPGCRPPYCEINLLLPPSLFFSLTFSYFLFFPLSLLLFSSRACALSLSLARSLALLLSVSLSLSLSMSCIFHLSLFRVSSFSSSLSWKREYKCFLFHLAVFPLFLSSLFSLTFALLLFRYVPCSPFLSFFLSWSQSFLLIPGVCIAHAHAFSLSVRSAFSLSRVL